MKILGKQNLPGVISRTAEYCVRNKSKEAIMTKKTLNSGQDVPDQTDIVATSSDNTVSNFYSGFQKGKNYSGQILAMIPAAAMLGFAFVFALAGAEVIVFVVYDEYSYSVSQERKNAELGIGREESKTSQARAVIIRLMSIVLLTIVSAMASYAIFRVMESSKRELQRRANYISVIIGLIAVFLLFTQPFLDKLFEGQSVNSVLKFIIFGGAATGT